MSVLRKSLRVSLIGLVSLLGSASLCHADVATATKYLDEAKDFVDRGNSYFDQATGKLDLAEASLDDVPAADKPALEARIKSLRDTISASTASQDKKILQSKLERAINDAEGAVGNLATWKGAADRVNELLDDPKTAQLFTADELAAYKKQFATFQKLNGSKALKQNLEMANQNVAQAETDWTETKGKLKEAGSTDERTRILDEAARDVENDKRFFQDLPDDNADVKALHARMQKISDELTAMSGDTVSAGELESINRFLDTYKTEFDGMDAETTPPTWKEFMQGNRKAQDLNAEHTREFVSRVGDYLKGLDESEDYKAAKNAPKVKALVTELQGKVDAGQKKLVKFATSVVENLEAEGVTAGNHGSADVLKNTIDRFVGADTAQGKALTARVDKKLTDFANAGEKADADKLAFYNNMKAQAEKAWPDMLAKFKTEEGFDPNNAAAFKGKLIKIETDNLMGYRFKPNGFPFATTLSGLPLACRYDPAVKNAIDDIEKQLGRGLGDDDNDGKFTIVCRVEGNAGQLIQLIKHEGQVNDAGGSNVGTVTGTEEKPVDAPILTIVAAHCGPLSVAAGQGAVKADGSVSTVAPVSGGSGGSGGTGSGVAAASGGLGIGGRLIGIVSGLFGLALGAACLMKANFAPLAANANAVQLQQRVGGQNIAYLGLAGIAWGLLSVLAGLAVLIHAPITGLITILMSAAMVVAGFAVSSSMFEEKQIVKPDLAAKIKSFAVPAGLACAALSLLGLVRCLIP